MQISVFKEFKFSAAHCLEIEGHKCSMLHGHNYQLRIEVTGDVNSDGMVVDFDDIKKAVNPLIDQLDHTVLNDKIKNTTSESLCIWFHEKLNTKIKGISKIEIRETETCGAILTTQKQL
jgi:6-pyruvoyltetrahydropterin/6-carboxytetrahydropterin synthase